MDFKYSITGALNGGEINGQGIGNVDIKSGFAELDVDFSEVAPHWDPRTIVLMCCSNGFSVAAFEHGDAKNLYNLSMGHLTIGRHLPGVCRHAVLRDSVGNIYVDIRASSDTKLTGDHRYDESKVESGYSQLTPGVSGIAKIAPVTGIMMQSGPNLINVLTTYEVTTEDNKTLHGFTFYPRYLPQQLETLPFFQQFDVEIVEHSYDAGHLHFKTYTSVARLDSELAFEMLSARSVSLV